MKKKASVRIIIGICAALGWWGLLYPELTLTPDTYRVIRKTDTIQNAPEVIEWDFDSDIYERLLSAKPEEIQFRSRLVQKINTFVEQRREVNESVK